MDPGPSRVGQDAEPAEYGEHDEDEVKQEHEARGMSFDHDALQIGRLRGSRGDRVVVRAGRLDPGASRDASVLP